MRVLKWLKRDRSNRRNSGEDLNRTNETTEGNRSSLGNCFSGDTTDDPIRTEEYKKALSEFFARRSLGNKVNRDEDKSKVKMFSTPQPAGRVSFKYDKRTAKTDPKPKRLSLPNDRSMATETLLHSEKEPKIQFLFSNQIVMNGKNETRKKGKARMKNKENVKIPTGLSDTSPDLLPSQFIRNKNVIDFDLDEEGAPSSPPADFFCENSLPYEDKYAKIDLRSKKSMKNDDHESQRPLLESSCASLDEHNTTDDLFKGSKDRLSDASCDNVARKLEKLCISEGFPRPLFRGVPLVRASALNLLPCPDSSQWTRASWEGVPLSLRNNTPQQGSETLARDLDVLTTIHHPNILLLMGLSYDKQHTVRCIFEECSSPLFHLIHDQGPPLTTLAAVQYLSDVSSAILFLHTSGYVHTALSSHHVLVTARGVAKLYGFELCCRILPRCNDTPPRHNKANVIESSSEEPEYINIREGVSEELLHDKRSSLFMNRECEGQQTSARQMFAYFRWQAPELFSGYDDLVYPTKKSDVYSLCLILWECCNLSVPWKTLDLQQLSDIYLVWETGIRLPKYTRYPQPVYDILSGGLSIKPNQRITMQELCRKFELAKKSLGSLDELSFNSSKQSSKNTKSEDSLCQSKSLDSDMEIKRAPVVIRNIKKYQVTDIDKEDLTMPKTNITSNADNVDSIPCQFVPETYRPDCTSLNTASLTRCNSKDELTDDDQLEDNSFQATMHKSDSTEYCPLFTPDVRRFASRLHGESLTLPCKLYFNDYHPDKYNPESKAVKLNASLTPKSYRSLDIQSPAFENMETIKSLTRSFETKIPKSKYKFDIKNSSLPTTPIARSTKIRKNAWLSEENQKDGVECNGSGDKDVSMKSDDKNTSDVCTSLPPLDAIDDLSAIDFGKKRLIFSNDRKGKDGSPRYRKCVLQRFSRNNTVCGLIPPTFDQNKSYTHPRDAVKYDMQKNLDKLSRSQSLTIKSQQEVTGVDIKPLVAIHEKWIQEVSHKSGRSLSLPDNYRGPLNAIKPASHVINPTLPANTSPQQKYLPSNKRRLKSPAKQSHTNVNYSDVPSSVRVAVTRKKIMNAKPSDFFENSLWAKEKEKCEKSLASNPQSTSTPYKQANTNPAMTTPPNNTDSCQHVCNKIMQASSGNKNKSRDEMDNKGNVSMESAKSSVLTELNDILKNIDKAKSLDESKPVPAGSVGGAEETQQETPALDRTYQTDHENLDAFFGSNDPDPNSASLKRCTGFSSLQEARSTEDMYIDDELINHIDTQSLSDNVQLLQLHNSQHEARCDKAEDCCLLKIQQQTNSQRIYILCEGTCKPEHDKSSTSSYVSSEEELLKKFEQDEREIAQTDNLIDLADSLNKSLSVIEEKPDEEYDNAQASTEKENTSKIIQDLISLYESVNFTIDDDCNEGRDENVIGNAVSAEKEISFFIVDDGEDSEQECANKSGMSDSIIDDVIHV